MKITNVAAIVGVLIVSFCSIGAEKSASATGYHASGEIGRQISISGDSALLANGDVPIQNPRGTAISVPIKNPDITRARLYSTRNGRPTRLSSPQSLLSRK